MSNGTIIHKNSEKNEMRISSGKEKLIINLSEIPIHEQINMVKNLMDWKENGYQGTPPI